jgi:tetratricopeptide (TPR) repeat protein
MTASQIPPTEQTRFLLTWAELQAAADQARLAYDYEQAASLYSKALADEDLPVIDRYNLLSGRAQCFSFLGMGEAEFADLETLWQTAQALNDCGKMVEVAERLSEAAGHYGLAEHTKSAVEEALDRARQGGNRKLEARALSALGRIFLANNEITHSREFLESALCQQLELGDTPGEAQTRLSYATLLSRSDPALAEEQAKVALSLFLSLGDRHHQALALNVLGLSAGDHARTRAYHEQAQAIFRSMNHLPLQTLMENNLAVLYVLLGLFTRARQYAGRSVAASRREGNRKALGYSLDTIAQADFELLDYAAAQAELEEGLIIVRSLGDSFLEGAYLLRLGRLALAQKHTVGAIAKLESSEKVLGETGESNGQATALAWLGAAHLASGNLVEAERYTWEACTQLATIKGQTGDFPLQDIQWWRYRVLRALSEEPNPPRPPIPGREGGTKGLGEVAFQALDDARRRMFSTIGSLSDPGLRRNYLNKVEINREILLEWAREVSRRGEQGDRVQIEPQMAGAGEQEQFNRMLEISLLERKPGCPWLLDFIVEELIRLSGPSVPSLCCYRRARVTTLTAGFQQ